ncbi:MAG TPA: glycosyltransferase, partial [Lachnoclostridium sp.]|nr:glycosyltransferase [Lachnoclostridium sp.]
SFYNPDLFQFNLYAEESIPNEQDFFSREVNTMRNTSNAIAYTGSNTVILREAMEEIGGFPLKTITEDFETSIRIQKAGFITYATDEIQAAGLTTTTIKSMIRQRVRWARGIIQSLQNTHAIVTPGLPLLARLTYLNTFLYWCSFFNRLIFILSPILFALFDYRIVNSHFWDVIVLWLPAYFFYSLSMSYLSSNVRNQRWSQIIDTIFMPYLIVPVLLETFHIHQRKFKVTNK